MVSALAQSLVNTAAEMTDAATRGRIEGGMVVYQHRPGYEAFSVSASETRYYDDDAIGIVEIDDALTVTAITRDGSALTLNTDYYLEPANRGNGPYTRIRFITTTGSTGDWASGVSRYQSNTWPSVRRIAVTGTWGFCTLANRPAAVKELTLILAQNIYESQDLSLTDVVGAVMNPDRYLDARAERMVRMLRRVQKVRVA